MSLGDEATGVTSEKSEPGIYASLVLPTLLIGTVGGGTQIPTAKESLNMIGCLGTVILSIIYPLFFFSTLTTPFQMK